MFRKLTVVLLLFTFVPFVSGCNAYATADKAYHAIDAVLGVALAELPSLQNTGIISASEALALTHGITGVHTLNDAYGTCVEGAHSAGNKKSAFLSCGNTFAAALSNPQLLAEIRVVNPKAQQRVQVWVIAVSTALNLTLAGLGGTPVQAPVISSVQPSQQQLDAFKAQAIERMEATN